MSEDENLPPIIGRVKAEWRDERVVLTLPDNTELLYTLEQCAPMYTIFYEQRRFLAGASYSVLYAPDGGSWFRLSGEGAVQLYAFLRELRHARNIPDPPDPMADWKR